MDQTPDHFRDQLIGLCHLLSADRWEALLSQACRLLMLAVGGERAVLFLTDATGQGVELAAAQAIGDTHWSAELRHLDVGPSVGSLCPLSQVAQTGRLLSLFNGSQGYDFSRLEGLLAPPNAQKGVLVLPLRGSRETKLLGLAAVQIQRPLGEANAQLRLLLTGLSDALAMQMKFDRQANVLRNMQSRLDRQDDVQRVSKAHNIAGVEAQFVGRSPAIRNVRDRLVQLADRHQPLLILGDDGTGKERAARLLHQLSLRRNGGFVYVDCAGMSAATLVSELTGFKRGAVPGQSEGRRGLLREAAGGTLFLDRLDRVGEEVQIFLARLLETGRYRALGSERDAAFDARLIFAARPELSQQVEDKRFLPGLSFMLMRNVLRLPALGDRPDDIALIADGVLAKLSGAGFEPVALSSGALAQLRSMEYPANLRQLEALVERAASFIKDSESLLLAGHIEAALDLQTKPITAPEAVEGLRESVARFEAELIRRALKSSNGDRALAADFLNLPKRTLADKCNRYAL
jgi:sigma-54-specific transcriptional regulator